MHETGGTYEYILKCGCVAHGRKVIKGEYYPCCIVHNCIEVADEQPNLEGRNARCAYTLANEEATEAQRKYYRSRGWPICKGIVPSSIKLAFFEYRGPGSPSLMCKHCHYTKGAHERHSKNSCYNFEPHGPYKYDYYYCGCRGWD